MSKKEDYIVINDTPYNDGKTDKKYYKAGETVPYDIGRILAKYGKACPKSDEAGVAKAEKNKAKRKRLKENATAMHKAMSKIGNGRVQNTSAPEGAKRA